jgi:hypothetical protein
LIDFHPKIVGFVLKDVVIVAAVLFVREIGFCSFPFSQFAVFVN